MSAPRDTHSPARKDGNAGHYKKQLFQSAEEKAGKRQAAPASDAARQGVRSIVSMFLQKARATAQSASAYVIIRQHTSTYVNVCLQKLRATAQSASAYVSIGAGKSSISRMWCSHGVHVLEQTVEKYWTQVTTIVATHAWPTTHNFQSGSRTSREI